MQNTRVRNLRNDNIGIDFTDTFSTINLRMTEKGQEKNDEERDELSGCTLGRREEEEETEGRGLEHG